MYVNVCIFLDIVVPFAIQSYPIQPKTNKPTQNALSTDLFRTYYRGNLPRYSMIPDGSIYPSSG